MMSPIFGQYKTNEIIFYAGVSLALLLYSHHSTAQELGLDSFVLSILKNNPGVQKILAEKDIANKTLESSLGIDDAVVSSSITASHTEPNKILGIEANRSSDTRLNLSYDRLFSNSGTRLSLGYVNQYTDRDPGLAALGEQYYQPSFTLRVTQPLLKNAGGIQDQLNIKLNKLNLKLSGLNSQENLENYITQLATLYIDWYLTGREVDISKEVHQQAIAQEKLTRTKVQRQVSEPYELLRAQETREDYYSRWQQALGRYTGLTHQIKYQMNLYNKPGTSIITPKDPSASRLLKREFSAARLTNYLDKTSRLKAILETLKEQQIILLDAKNNSLSSDLNLSFGYTRHGIDDSLSESHSSSFNKDDYSVMLEYKYPLGGRQATGNYHAQLAQKKQVESDTQQRLIDARATLANLRAQSSQLIIAIKSIDRKIILAERKLKSEKRLYKIGKLDLFELLRDQSSQMESRLNRERLFTQNLTLQLKIGELLDHNLDTYTSVSNPTSSTMTGNN